jgi:hypothetical protein
MKLVFGMPGIGGWLMIGIVLLAFLLPFIVLVDIVRSDFKGPNDKLIRVLIVLVMNFIGSILYLMIGRKQKT